MRKYDLSSRSAMVADHDYADVPNINKLSGYKKAAIPYIAGYAVKTTKKSLSCEECSAGVKWVEIHFY